MQQQQAKVARALYLTICLENGAPRGARTPDPLITNQVLYQLSYRGTPLT